MTTLCDPCRRSSDGSEASELFSVTTSVPLQDLSKRIGLVLRMSSALSIAKMKSGCWKVRPSIFPTENMQRQGYLRSPSLHSACGRNKNHPHVWVPVCVCACEGSHPVRHVPCGENTTQASPSKFSLRWSSPLNPCLNKNHILHRSIHGSHSASQTRFCKHLWVSQSTNRLPHQH